MHGCSFHYNYSFVYAILMRPGYVTQSMVSGYPVANRREARKLGLLRISKSSEAERERM